jgi:hypothetical protein
MVLKRVPKGNLPGYIGDERGGGFRRKRKISRCTIPKLHVLTKIFKKTWKFPNKKGTFDVKLVFTATLACTKRELFITKKGTFHHKKGHF